MNKLICVGFNKTGTSTFGKCVDLLGLGPVARPQVMHDSLQFEFFRDYVSYPLLGSTDGSLAQDHLTGHVGFGEYPYRALCDQVFDNRNYGLALQVAMNFRSFHDRPWNVGDLYKAMDAAFPGSKFVLTWRDPERWWRSVERWLLVSHPDDQAKFSRYLKHLSVDGLDKDKFITGYLEHNERIRRYFACRTDLLELNFENGDKWEKLCAFLGVALPDVPFPHENRQAYVA